MKRRTGIAGLVWVIAAGAVLLSLIVFVLLLGPSRAVAIAAAAALNVAVDGFAEDPGPHRIPVVDLEVTPSALDSLQADLPWSGSARKHATLVHNGVRHPVKFRYRGALTPSHFLGEKRSFRLTMGRRGPWAPYRKVNVIVPKSFNMVGNHMATWIAGTMGVPVPMNELVFVRINGEDHGVMELYEQIDGGFEQNRHLVAHEVPVYKGDYPPITGRALPKGRTLWSDASFWEHASDAGSTVARAKLEALVAALVKDTLSITAHRDTIAQLIDVDAFLRFQAALLVVNSMHIDQYHNHWLVLDPRTDRFYPIIWDALLMYAPEGEPLYYVNDAMAWWIMRVPEWRLQRDRYAYRALVELQREGIFSARLDAVLDRIRPSVLADRNKYGNVTLFPEDVHRFSLVHVIGSVADMRASVAAYWERVLARYEAKEVTVERGEGLRLRATCEAPLRLRWEGAPDNVRVNGVPAEVTEDGGAFTFVLHRTLRPPPGGKDHPLADRQHLLVEPLDATVVFANGTPASLRITNAITDEAVE